MPEDSWNECLPEDEILSESDEIKQDSDNEEGDEDES